MIKICGFSLVTCNWSKCNNKSRHVTSWQCDSGKHWHNLNEMKQPMPAPPILQGRKKAAELIIGSHWLHAVCSSPVSPLPRDNQTPFILVWWLRPQPWLMLTCCSQFFFSFFATEARTSVWGAWETTQIYTKTTRVSPNTVRFRIKRPLQLTFPAGTPSTARTHLSDVPVYLHVYFH